jgi:hypothetical protein
MTSAQAQAAAAGNVIPRVSAWGIWNEPNEGTWLDPQYRVAHHHHVLVAPLLYRQLVDSAYTALVATGHGSDTIMVLETASGGTTKVMPFLRALYCVDRSLRPLTGDAATAIGCPADGDAASFAAAHPGLFTAIAHHPYSFDVPPSTRFPLSQYVTIANLPQFEHVLNRIFSIYGRLPTGGVPMYLTEWGYKTNPPNPYVKTSLTQQARWLDEGEYMTWRDSYVRSLNQFLLVDDTPRQGAKPGSLSYWSTFQTGLMFADDSPKPSYASFRLPIWLPHARHGRSVAVWAQLRPAQTTGNHVGVLEFQASGGGTWSNLRRMTASGPENFLFFHVPIPSAGNVRMAWYDPRVGTVYYSRTVRVS